MEREACVEARVSCFGHTSSARFAWSGAEAPQQVTLHPDGVSPLVFDLRTPRARCRGLCLFTPARAERPQPQPQRRRPRSAQRHGKRHDGRRHGWHAKFFFFFFFFYAGRR
eukprot:5223177-Prymnesium_polylepis.1